MARIENPGVMPLTLPTRHVIPGRGALETTNDVILAADNEGTIAALSLSGAVTITLDPVQEPVKAKK